MFLLIFYDDVLREGGRGSVGKKKKKKKKETEKLKMGTEREFGRWEGESRRSGGEFSERYEAPEHGGWSEQGKK